MLMSMAAKEKTSSRWAAWLAPILFLLAAVAAAGPASALTCGALQTRAWEKTPAPLESRLDESLQLLNLHQQNGGAGYDDALGSPLAAESAGVAPYEVDTYGNLRSRSLVGDGLDLDHQPSNASNIASAEAALGRELTPAEAAAIRDQGTAVAVPQQWHRSFSPTYGGRNTLAQIQADALDPLAAATRDSQAMIDGASAANRAAAEAAAAQIRQAVGGR
jgi:hypothetical protein